MVAPAIGLKCWRIDPVGNEMSEWHTKQQQIRRPTKVRTKFENYCRSDHHRKVAVMSLL